MPIGVSGRGQTLGKAEAQEHASARDLVLVGAAGTAS